MSSNVNSHDYDYSTRKLKVAFNNGSVYHYLNIDPILYEKFKNSKSLGTFLHNHIKGKFKYVQVR